MKPQETAVLIPAYNEEKNISLLVKQVMDLGYPVIVSDDGSKDKTVEYAKRLGAEVLTTPVNRGKGAALRRGFDYFLKTSYQGLVMIDADGQHDPRELVLFREALTRESHALWIGKRMHEPKGMPFIRRATNRLMSWIISSIAGQKIPDTQCGYRAIRREALGKISLSTDRYEIESEMILEAARSGLKVGSVPIRCVYANQKSEIRPMQDTLRFFKFLLRYSAKKR